MTRLRGVRCPRCGSATIVDVENDGIASTGCARCALSLAAGRTAAVLAGPSLAQLVSAQNAIGQLQHLGPSLALPLTGEHIATIAYALGVLSAERLNTKGTGL